MLLKFLQSGKWEKALKGSNGSDAVFPGGGHIHLATGTLRLRRDPGPGAVSAPPPAQLQPRDHHRPSPAETGTEPAVRSPCQTLLKPPSASKGMRRLPCECGPLRPASGPALGYVPPKGLETRSTPSCREPGPSEKDPGNVGTPEDQAAFPLQALAGAGVPRAPSALGPLGTRSLSGSFVFDFVCSWRERV